MIRLWGCRRCGVVTTWLDGAGWCRDCITVEALYRRLENYRIKYAREREAAYRFCNNGGNGMPIPNGVGQVLAILVLVGVLVMLLTSQIAVPVGLALLGLAAARLT